MASIGGDRESGSASYAAAPSASYNRGFVIIGSANVDFIMKVAVLPARGETVTDGAFLQTFGGKGANQAVAAARAGAAVSFVACVGSDPFGAEMETRFAREGMNLSGLKRSKTQPSGSALVMVERSGENYLTVAPGANYDLLPVDVAAQRETIQGAGLCLLQMEVPLETNLAAAAWAAEAGVPVMLNYAPARLRSPELLRHVHTLIVNESEAAFLVGDAPLAPGDAPSALAAARALCGDTRAGDGPRRVIITLGAAGCVVCDATLPSESFHAPAFNVDPTDATAAGDTFCGALGTALLEGTPLRDAVRFASAAAAITVTRLGAQPSIPARHEVDAFLRERTTRSGGCK